MSLPDIVRTQKAGKLLDDLTDPIKRLEVRIAQLEANEGAPPYSESYAIIQEQRTSGTAPTPAGLTASTWVTRGLTTVLTDPDSIVVSLASNQFELGAGEYWIKARSPAFNTNRHKIRLRNITDGSTAIVGSTQISGNSSGNDTFVSGRVVIASAKVFEIQHWSELTIGNAAGIATGSGEIEVYTVVEIIKLN